MAVRRTVAAGLVVVLAVVLAGCGTQIPDLRGKTAAQAEQALLQAGFKLGKVSYDEKAQGAAGAVIGQDPESSTRVAAASIVNIVVAGPPPVVVPDIRRLKKEQALAALSAMSLLLGSVTETFNATVAAGSVTSQTPASGEQAPRGSSIAVVVSKGPQPKAVPSVAKKRVEDAKKLLTTAGFKVQTSDKEDAAEKGTVLSQTPVAGKLMQPGAVVKLTVSSGIALVRVPDVLAAIRNHSWRNSYDQNPSAIAEEVMGFVSDRLASGGLRGKCILQSVVVPDRQVPKAGAMVRRGTLVRVYVGFGD